MWSKKVKDQKIRSAVLKTELSNFSKFFILKNKRIDSSAKVFVLKSFLNSNSNSFFSQIKNRCIVSGRSRSPLKFFKLSRILFRQFASNGLILGVKKSSW